MRPPFSKSNSSGGSSSNNSNRNSTKRRTHSKAGTTTILHPMLLLLVLLFASLRFSRASYTIEVPHGQEECVYVRVPAKSFISGNYDCLDDDIDGSMIQATLRRDNQAADVKWKSSSDQTEGTFRVPVEPDRYALCFESKIKAHEGDDDSEATHIGFSLRWIPPPRALPEGEEGPEAKRALQLVETASFVDQDWQNLLDHYDFLRNREANHREMIESIFSRLWKWTLVEAILVVFMAFFQVMYLKKFFEQRRYL